MKTFLYVSALFLVLAIAGAGWLFWIQNSQQEVLTSFEIWGGFRWGRTWTVPVLISVSGGVGAFVGLVVGWWVTASLKNRRIRALGQAKGSSESSW